MSHGSIALGHGSKASMHRDGTHAANVLFGGCARGHHRFKSLLESSLVAMQYQSLVWCWMVTKSGSICVGFTVCQEPILQQMSSCIVKGWEAELLLCWGLDPWRSRTHTDTLALVWERALSLMLTWQRPAVTWTEVRTPYSRVCACAGAGETRPIRWLLCQLANWSARWPLGGRA